MNEIKNAFLKVKQDIDLINKEISSLKQSLSETQNQILKMNNLHNRLISQQKDLKLPIQHPTHLSQNSTVSTHPSTHNLPFKPLKDQNIEISTGNQGVPTDRQTDRQTHQQTEKTYFGDAFDILNSLDNIKKEIRSKFKKITDQEFLVFSTIYQLEEQDNFVDYKSVSQKLNLTESSIRDYVGRLIKKGIPVEKKKINNKTIQLSISEKLRRIAPLPTIFQLREL